MGPAEADGVDGEEQVLLHGWWAELHASLSMLQCLPYRSMIGKKKCKERPARVSSLLAGLVKPYTELTLILYLKAGYVATVPYMA